MGFLDGLFDVVGDVADIAHDIVMLPVDYLEEAKEYRVKVRSMINEISSLRKTVLGVSDAQKEELKMLSIIKSAYQSQGKKVLTKSAQLLREIAELCLQEVTSNTNARYNDLLRQLNALWS